MDPITPQVYIYIDPPKRKAEHSLSSHNNKKIKTENAITSHDKHFPTSKNNIPLELIKNILFNVGFVHLVRLRTLNKNWKALILEDVELVNCMRTAYSALKRIDEEYKFRIPGWTFASNEKPTLLHYFDMWEWEGLEKTLENIVERFDKNYVLKVINSFFRYVANDNYHYLKNDMLNIKKSKLRDYLITKSNYVDYLCKQNLNDALAATLTVKDEHKKNILISKIADKLLFIKSDIEIEFVKKLSRYLGSGEHNDIYQSVDKLLINVVHLELLRERPEEAKCTLNLFKTEEYKNIATIDVVKKIALNDIDDALNYASLITQKKYQDKAISQVVACQAFMDTEQAKNMLKLIYNKIYKDLALIEIVKIEAKLNLTKAFNTIKLVDNASIKVALYRFAIGHPFEMPLEIRAILLRVK